MQQPRDLVDAWWAGLDEFTRRRVLRLQPDDLLPADLAEDLRRGGLRVTQLRPSPAGHDLWAQPEPLLVPPERQRSRHG